MKSPQAALQSVHKPVQLGATPVGGGIAVKLLAIGTVSEASGVPIDTLRTWERRYGFPTPSRTGGGQRLYAPEAVDQLLAVRRAIASGLAVSRAIRLIASEPVTEPLPRPHAPAALPALAWLERWLHLVSLLDGDALEQSFRREHGLLGTMKFLTERSAPFLDALGDGWANGRISVANEHFASERLRDFLAGIWWPIAAENRGPTVLCVTLPGEHHQLGLHMAAATLALAGLRVVFLGANLPAQDTAVAAKLTSAAAVVISLSRVVEPPTVRRELQELRLALGDRVAIVVGGSGAPTEHDAVIAPGSLSALATWAASLFKD